MPNQYVTGISVAGQGGVGAITTSQTAAAGGAGVVTVSAGAGGGIPTAMTLGGGNMVVGGGIGQMATESQVLDKHR